MTTTTHGTVIRYTYETDSLADVPANEFEARLYDALKAKWPGAHIDIAQGGTRRWGETIDGQEITGDELSVIGNDVFEAICRGN